MTIAAGSRLGPYEILAPIGAGGMGEVYRAKDSRLGREVAIKVLPAALSSDPERLSRFEQEARAASALNHPNIVTVYEIGREGEVPWIAMELVEGHSLRSLLASGPVPVKRLLAIAAQVAEGLAKAHAAGIAHRDLKPENLMISSDGFVKIVDFGLAKLAPSAPGAFSQAPTAGPPQTLPGAVLGTVGYMSPEQASGREIDARSDQFSFGSILYEMATGQRAFQKNTPVETLSAIIREEPKPIAGITPEAPAPLTWIVERCLAKDPEERYASTRDLARELASLRDHLSEISRSGEAAVSGEIRPGRTRASRWSWAAAGAALGLIAGALLFAALRHEAPTEPVALRYLTYSGHDRAPTVSPDGRTVAFTSDRDGVNRVWLKQLAGGGEAALTSGPDEQPRFSPDGSMILFAHREPLHSSLYRTGIVGGEPRKLIDDAAEGDWSPDGKRIVFLRWTSEGGRIDSRIGLAGPEGGDAREILRIQGHQLNQPRWSPDGRIAVTSEIGAGGAPKSLFFIDTEKKNFQTMPPQSRFGVVSALAWSGSAGDIVYSQSESVVAAVASSSGRMIRQSVRSGRSETLFWSPTASQVVDIVAPGQIVFDARSLRENLQEFSFEGRNLLGQGRWLTQGSSTDRQPAYSPDREWVVFSSTRSGNLDLWAVSTKTGAVRRMTDDAAEDWDPGFTRDGKKLLWSSNRSGAFEIWIAEADGSGARQLTRDGRDAENPTATPDGQWIVYNQGTGPHPGIWKIHPDGSSATLLVAGNTVLPEVSPDGRYVSYRTNLATDVVAVRVARVSDGSPVPFEVSLRSLAGFFSNSVGRSRWLPDGRQLLFAGQDEKGTYGIYAQDFVPGKDTTLSRVVVVGFDPKIAAESFGISPDGTHITVACWEQVFSLMIAEHVPGIMPPHRSSSR